MPIRRSLIGLVVTGLLLSVQPMVTSAPAAPAAACPEPRGVAFPGSYSATFTADDSYSDSLGEGRRTATLSLTVEVATDGVMRGSGSYTFSDAGSYRDFYWREGVPGTWEHTISLQYTPVGGYGTAEMQETGTNRWVQDKVDEKQLQNMVRFNPGWGCGETLTGSLPSLAVRGSLLFEQHADPYSGWAAYPLPNWNPDSLTLTATPETAAQYREQTASLRERVAAAKTGSYEEIKQKFHTLMSEVADTGCPYDIVATGWAEVLMARQQWAIEEMRAIADGSLTTASFRELINLRNEVWDNDRELSLLQCQGTTEELMSQVVPILVPVLRELLKRGAFGSASELYGFLAAFDDGVTGMVITALEDRSRLKHRALTDGWDAADATEKARLAREAMAAESLLNTLNGGTHPTYDFLCQHGMCYSGGQR